MNEQILRDLFETKAKYHEILVLEVRLCDAGIPHTFNPYMGGVGELPIQIMKKLFVLLSNIMEVMVEKWTKLK